MNPKYPFQIRTMRSADMDCVLKIQAACYGGDIPESRISLMAKLQASPATCFVAEHDSKLLAYLISMPWKLGSPPTLNASDCRLPIPPDCNYLHDLSVHPQWRGSGVGAALIKQFFKLCHQNSLPACLVAVQGSAGYWGKFGFVSAQADTELAWKLATYGENVEFMVLHSHHDMRAF